MFNDISSLLLTIADASSGFVAILGGFIASKLISIKNNRDVAKSSLEEVNLSFRASEVIFDREVVHRTVKFHLRQSWKT